MSYIAYPPESHARMLEIKAKSKRDKNIFNADPEVKIGGTEATNMNANAGSSKPAVLCPPRRSSLVLGVDSGGYTTEASSHFNSTKQQPIRESYKPAYISVSNNRVVLRGKTPDANLTTAQSDFKNFQHTPTKRNKIWGNHSNVEFHSGHDGGFVTEAKSAYVGSGGRPATSFKPMKVAPPKVVFDHLSSAAQDYRLPQGFKYQGRAGKPQAARSEITEQQLIQSIDTVGQIEYGTEARSNYIQKQRLNNPRVYRTSEGVGFGGGQEDRDFTCEGQAQYNKKERVPADKNKWTEKKPYVREEDDRDWHTETKAQHSHGGPPVSTLRKQQAVPVVMPPPQASSSRLSARQSRQPSQQASRRPSQQASRVPTGRMSARPAASTIPEYIPTISPANAQAQERPVSSKRQSQYSRPASNSAKGGIAPVAGARRKR